MIYLESINAQYAIKKVFFKKNVKKFERLIHAECELLVRNRSGIVSLEGAIYAKRCTSNACMMTNGAEEYAKKENSRLRCDGQWVYAH